MEPYLTTDDVAAHLKIHQRTVYRMYKRGRLSGGAVRERPPGQGGDGEPLTGAAHRRFPKSYHQAASTLPGRCATLGRFFAPYGKAMSQVAGSTSAHPDIVPREQLS